MNKSHIYIQSITTVLLSAIFIFSATAKLLYWDSTVYAMFSIVQIDWITPIIAIIVIIIEYGIALVLINTGNWKSSAFMIIGVIIAFTIVAFYAKYLGRISDCGCFGELFGTPVDWRLIVRNTTLVVLAGILLFPVKEEQSLIDAYNSSRKMAGVLLFILNSYYLGRIIGLLN